MKTSRCEIAVVGAGAMGLATTYHLAKQGHDVVLIERFGLGHDRGSSHGAARITRHSYSDRFYAELMPRAFDSWRKLEADAGETIYLRTGGVSFSPPDVAYVAQVASHLESIAIPHHRCRGREWNRLHRVFQLPDDFDVVFEPDAGILRASRILQLEAELAVHHNAATQILADTPVSRIDLDGDRPQVHTPHGVIEPDRLVVTVGTWTGKLFPTLAHRFQPTRQVVAYFQPIKAVEFELGRFPVFIYKGPGDLDAFYGMPSGLGMGVKVARHGGPPVDPDHLRSEPNDTDLRPVREFVAQFLPELASAVIERTETCLYNMAKDDHFQLGLLPGRNDVAVASPCSGHGFKFSCLIGEILAELAVTGQVPYDITPWRLG